MGRQKGQSQRTKGNVRPSSSSRAATLLQDDQRFVGFESLSGELGYVPMLKSLEDDQETSIDPDIRVSLNKLGKKDVITKVKALTELADLYSTKPSVNIIAVLMYWPRLYNRLCDDSDRKVRESCQVAFTSLLKSVGKEVAPYLKGIMGWWLISQNDPHPPVMSAAKNAFVVAFPTEEKQKKALLFCSKEIIHCVDLNLFGSFQMHGGSSSSLNHDAKDRERRISASLNAMSSFLTIINPIEPTSTSYENIQAIFVNPKLWKFSKDRSPLVRAAFYSLSSSCCKFLPDIASLQLTSTAKCILHKLDESNPLVAKSIWEAAISFINMFNTWHEYIDIRKGFLPQLWAMLKKGFYGNAKMLCIHVPLLLRSFPPSLAVSSVYVELFKCLEIGLQIEKARRSSIESNAIIECFFQCVLVTLQKIFESCNDDNLTVATLLWNQHTFPLLMRSAIDSSSHVSASTHREFASFLNKFLSSILSIERSDSIEFCSLIRKNLAELGNELIDKCCNCNEMQACFLAYINLLSELKFASTFTEASSNVKKSKTVKFETDEQLANSGTEHAQDFVKITNNALVSLLEKCVCDNITSVVNTNADPLLKMLLINTLLKKFSSVSLFEMITDLSELENDPPFFFVCNRILPLIEQVELGSCSRDHYAEIANSLYFAIRHCQRNIANSLKYIFSDLDQCNGHQICIFLAQCVIGDHDLISLCGDRKWLTEFIMKTVEELVHDVTTTNDRWNLLEAVLSEPKLVSPQEAHAILKYLNKYVNNYSSRDVLIHVTSLYGVWFTAYSDIADPAGLAPEFLNIALRPLLQMICKCPEEELLACFKSFLSSLLKKSYTSDKLETKNFVLNLYCHCATYLRGLFFEKQYEYETPDGFTQSIVLMAEELVMHHTKQTSIIQWIDCVFRNEEQFAALRLPLASDNWPVSQFLRCKFQSSCLSELANDFYFVAVQVYVDLTAELFTIFSETYKNVLQQPQYSILFLESLFCKAISPSNSSNLLKVDEFLSSIVYSELLTKIVQNCVDYGNGWILILDQFSLCSSDDQWDSIAFMDLIKLDSLEISKNLLQTLEVFIERGAALSVLQKILEWCLQKFVDNHLQYVKESVQFSPDILRVLVSLFKKIGKLQESKPLYINHDEFTPCHIQIIKKITTWKSFSGLFLFDVDLTEVPLLWLHMNLEIIKFLECVVNIWPSTLNTETWDFIECSLLSWMESCAVTFKHSKAQYKRVVKDLFFSVCSLMVSLEEFITSPAALSDPSLPSALATEWGEFYKPAAHSSLISIFTVISPEVEVEDCLLEIVGKCLATITSSSLLASASALEPHFLPDSRLSNDFQTLLHYLSVSLIPRNLTDFSVRIKISYSLLNLLTGEYFANIEDKGGCEPPLHLIKVLGKLLPAVDEVISLIPFQNPVDLEKKSSDENSLNESLGSDVESEIEFDDSQIETLNSSYVLSYLLVWKLVIKLFQFVPAEARTQYAASLNRNQLTDVPTLLSKILFLFPKYPFIVTHVESIQSKIDMFKEEVDLNLSISNSFKIQHCVCTLYKEILIYLPIYARTWFNGLQKKDRHLVNNFTATHATPVITKAEMESISKRSTPSGLNVRPRITAREVVATYEISDANFQITIELPTNYPLVPVQINTVHKVGISSSQWRYWLLQMTMLLHRQNGKIVDALTLWKDKVDKKLDGIEECMICFSVVHGSNSHSLPKLQCKTCRKRFHAECLYKWFDTSNQSTCPLCRSPMMFR